MHLAVTCLVIVGIKAASPQLGALAIETDAKLI